ncbi:MAG TPA: DNA repair exonuclease [Caldisericia bacterium]|mgnify:CR=1 FL=1|nr:DNA repair exonuclease [Caldisericia bacterium]
MSRNIRFIHCSDLHLEAPFKGIHLENEGIWKILEGSTFRSFEKVVQTAITQEVDFVLIAGDLYNSSNKSVRAQLFFLHQMKLLADHNIPCLFVHGNHDPIDSWVVKSELPSTIFQFPPYVFCKSLYRTHEEKPFVNIIGYSYPKRDVQKNIAQEIAQHSRSLDQDTFNIGLLHCNVGGDPSTENYAPCSLQDLLQSNIHYWALGHVHTRKVLHENQPAVIYPGNTQGLHINESQQKGLYLVDVHDQEVDYRWIETSSFLWFQPTLQVADSTIDSISEDVIQAMIENTQSLPGIFRFTLEGRTSLHHILQKEIHEIEDSIRENLEQEYCYLESINLQTKPDIDIEAIKKRKDFNSLFAHKAEELLNSEDISVKIATLLTDMPLDKLFKILPENHSSIPWENIVTNALYLGLTLLAEEKNES